MRTIEISVGAFMVAGMLALVFLAVNVSGINVGSKEDTYTLYARFGDVAGLTPRARVSLAGVTIGRVVAIEVDPVEAVAVVELEVQSRVNGLSLDTGARILTDGILGGKYIGLEPGADDLYLEDGDTIEITQGAMVLENLIGDFIQSMGSS